jgi:hypothetical protein
MKLGAKDITRRRPRLPRLPLLLHTRCWIHLHHRQGQPPWSRDQRQIEKQKGHHQAEAREEETRQCHLLILAPPVA